jgi:two-component system, NarL family, nitrate/nitrite response regulator NarL
MCAVRLGFFDDHPILLQGLVDLFNAHPNFEVVTCGSSVEEAVGAVEKHELDLVALDLGMPGDVFDAASKLCRNYPNLKIAIFTASSNAEYAVHALEVGVTGYILKGSTAAELQCAIEQVASGGTYIAPAFAAKVIMSLKSAFTERKQAALPHLSIREEQIVRLLLGGCTNKEIASSLCISEKTVKHYMTEIMQKLNVRNRLEVVLAARGMDDRARGSRLQ